MYRYPKEVCPAASGIAHLLNGLAKRREVELKALRDACDERENQKRVQEYEVRQSPLPHPLGRAWTMNGDHNMTHIPRPSPSTAAQNSMPINEDGGSSEPQVTRPPADISDGGPNSKSPMEAASTVQPSPP